MWQELWDRLRHREDAPLLLSPLDLAELEAAAARVAGEYALSAPEIIAATAGRLLRRRVPIRGIVGTAVAQGVAELRFADGTSVIVRADHPGDLSRIAITLIHGRVALLGFVTDGGRVALEVAHDSHRLRVTALGVRQPS